MTTTNLGQISKAGEASSLCFVCFICEFIHDCVSSRYVWWMKWKWNSHRIQRFLWEGANCLNSSLLLIEYPNRFSAEQMYRYDHLENEVHHRRKSILRYVFATSISAILDSMHGKKNIIISAENLNFLIFTWIIVKIWETSLDFDFRWLTINLTELFLGSRNWMPIRLQKRITHSLSSRWPLGILISN